MMWIITEISFFRLMAPSLHPGEVGSFPSTGCLVPQPFATGGNRLYPVLLGYNWRLIVPELKYPDSNEACFFFILFAEPGLMVAQETIK
jgi:hypothetical protein